MKFFIYKLVIRLTWWKDPLSDRWGNKKFRERIKWKKQPFISL